MTDAAPPPPHDDARDRLSLRPWQRVHRHSVRPSLVRLGVRDSMGRTGSCLDSDDLVAAAPRGLTPGIVLLAGECRPAAQLAELVGCSEPTVIHWRRRFERLWLGGLEDEPGSVVRRRWGPTSAMRCWRPRCCARRSSWGRRSGRRGCWPARSGWHFTQVARIWREWRIQPRREGTFKFSTDPQLEAKVRDVIGPCSRQPARCCAWAKAGVGAYSGDAAAAPGLPARRTHDSADTAPPRCSPRWRLPPAKSPTPAYPEPSPRVPAVPRTSAKAYPRAAAPCVRQLQRSQTPPWTETAGRMRRSSVDRIAAVEQEERGTCKDMTARLGPFPPR